MSDTATEMVFKRDRLVILSALAVLTLLAWGYIAWLARQPMSPMAEDMPGMAMPDMAMPTAKAWSLADYGFLFAMWAVMMIGMMTPSVAPAVLLYAAVGRKAADQGKPLAATGWFVSGYLLCWVLFALCAAAIQLLLANALLLTPAMGLVSGAAAGAVLVAAGVYQWSPLKTHCLSHCQTPMSFIQRHGGFRQTSSGALRLGTLHGFYCVGCCWVLMALLFVGGVMNLLWIAALSILVLAEKVLPAGHLFARIVGTGLVAAGGWLLLRSIL